MQETCERITSEANAKIKLAARLQQRKQRAKMGLFVAEGVRLAEMAAASNWQISFALVSEHAVQQPRVRKILARLKEKQVPVGCVSEALYAKASGTEHPQGLLLVLVRKTLTLDALGREAGARPCYVVLDGVQDPGNLGTILRTADAAGMSGVILLKGCTDAFSPKVVRAAMGSLFYLPLVAEVSREDFFRFAGVERLRLYATALDAAAEPHFAADYTGATGIVFGNEGNGVSRELLDESKKIYIPMFGRAESLNVAVSSAVVLYEVVRQRHMR